MKVIKQRWQRLSRVMRGAVALTVVVLAAGIIAGVVLWSSHTQAQPDRPENKYVAFTSDVYDQIAEHYWKDLTDGTLSSYYAKAVSKVTETDHNLATTTKDRALSLFTSSLEDIPPEKRVAYTKRVNALVVNSLQPQRRNTLFTKKDEQELRDTVANVDRDKNLYEILGVEKDASTSTVEEQFTTKTQELDARIERIKQEKQTATSSARKKELAQQQQQIEKQKQKVAHARNVLTNENDKKRYDKHGSEPTVLTERLTPEIFYMDINKVSPTTLQEFVEAANSTAEMKQLDTLIIDLRGNMGGAIDILPHFLGPFIGNDHVAYRLFRHDEKKPTKTKTGWLNSLVKFKNAVVLIDGEAKSSAEVMAGTLKKFNVGTLVGTKTKGWGSVENTYPIETQITPDEKHTLLLVNHLTLRPNGTPIEGQGITPDVNITNDDWQAAFQKYHEDPELLREVERLVQDG